MSTPMLVKIERKRNFNTEEKTMEINVNSEIQGLGQQKSVPMHLGAPDNRRHVLGSTGNTSSVKEVDEDDEQTTYAEDSSVEDQDQDYDESADYDEDYDDEDEDSYEDEDEDSDEYTVRDMSDIFDDFPSINIEARLFVRLLATHPERQFYSDELLERTKTVQTSGGSVMNFYSPFCSPNNGKNPPGALREAVENILEYFDNSNSTGRVIIGDVDTVLEKACKPLQREIAKIIYNNFGTEDVVTEIYESDYEIDDFDEAALEELESDIEDYDDSESIEEEIMNEEEEEQPKFTVEDILDVSYWNSHSFSEDGTVNINLNVCIDTHSFEFYSADGPKKVQLLSRLRTFIKKHLQVKQLHGVSVAVGVVIDNDMLQYPEYSYLVSALNSENTVNRSGKDDKDSKDDVSKLNEFAFLTRRMLLSEIKTKERLLSTLEADSADSWDDDLELLPSNIEDANAVLKPTEIMFYQVIGNVSEEQ